MKDIVILDNKHDGKTISVPVGTILEVRLEGSRAGTGWEWVASKGDVVVHLNATKGQKGEAPSWAGLQPLPFGSEFLPDPKGADKAIGTYVFIFKAAKEGNVELHMQYITPGGPGVFQRLRSALVGTFKVKIDVTPLNAGGKADLTDAQMAGLAKQTAQKGKFQEFQDIRSDNQHLGGKWLLEQPFKQQRFWCVLHAYTPAAPVRSFIAVSRSGEVRFPFKSEDFAKLLRSEERSSWTDANYQQAAALYIHLTDTSHQDGWKILNSPEEFMAIKFNMFPQFEKKRAEAAQAILQANVARDKDIVRVRLYAWQLIGGVLREWNFEITPTDFKVASKELGRFGGGGYD